MGGRNYNYRNWPAPATGSPQREPAEVIRAELSRPYDTRPLNPADGIVSRFVVEWVASLTGRS